MFRNLRCKAWFQHEEKKSAIFCDKEIKAFVLTVPPGRPPVHSIVVVRIPLFVVIIGLQHNLGQLLLGGVIPSNSMVTPDSHHPHAALPKEAGRTGYRCSDTIDTQPIHSL
jgi:hypothetical protein